MGKREEITKSSNITERFKRLGNLIIKNKKNIVIVSFIILAIIILGTMYAYFSDMVKVTTVITSGNVSVELQEDEPFDTDVPEDGVETTIKTFRAVSTGTVNCYVRAKIIPIIEYFDTEENAWVVANIPISNIKLEKITPDWVESDGYYYYRYILIPKAPEVAEATSTDFTVKITNIDIPDNLKTEKIRATIKVILESAQSDYKAWKKIFGIESLPNGVEGSFDFDLSQFNEVWYMAEGDTWQDVYDAASDGDAIIMTSGEYSFDFSGSVGERENYGRVLWYLGDKDISIIGMGNDTVIQLDANGRGTNGTGDRAYGITGKNMKLYNLRIEYVNSIIAGSTNYTTCLVGAYSGDGILHPENLKFYNCLFISKTGIGLFYDNRNCAGNEFNNCTFIFQRGVAGTGYSGAPAYNNCDMKNANFTAELFYPTVNNCYMDSKVFTDADIEQYISNRIIPPVPYDRAGIFAGEYAW